VQTVIHWNWIFNDHSSIICIAESYQEDSIKKEERSLREFVNITLPQEDPKDIKKRIIQYIRDKGNRCSKQFNIIFIIDKAIICTKWYF
jgi:hypothetical protein